MPPAIDDEERKPSLYERLRPLTERIASYPDTGLKADKAFYDSLYEEPHGNFAETDLKSALDDQRR